MGVNVVQGRMDASGKKFVVVVSRWNELITKELLDGALNELERYGAQDVDIVQVPGTWELPIAVAKAIAQKPAAVIALGCILQGQTPHAKMLAGDVGSALMNLQLSSGIPIAWGVLTPDTQEQALDRAGLKLGNKGREAALAAIEMASVLEQL